MTLTKNRQTCKSEAHAIKVMSREPTSRSYLYIRVTFSLLFFLAFLPQFVNPKAGNVPGQMVLLGILFMLQAILIFSAVAVLTGSLSKKILAKPEIAKYINYAKVGIFTLIGVKLALTER